jgi:NADH-quinone oxidoreductase subunit F
MGGSEYAKLGIASDPGTRIVSISGHVKKPGYYEIQIGQATLGQLINDFAGGVRDGHKLKAVIPGGSSSKILKAGEKFKLKTKLPDGSEIEKEVALLDLPYDAASLAAAGSMSGSGAIIVMDDSTDMVEALANICAFYAHESCGQCTPCREGSLWMSKAVHRLARGGGRKQDADYLLSIANNIPGGRTICAFGEACSWPVQSCVAKFRDEFISKGATAEQQRQATTPVAVERTQKQ